MPAELTKAEESMLELVGKEREYDIYDYNLGDNVKSVQIWLEAYNRGEKIEDVGPLSLQQLNGKQGRIAIGLNQDRDFAWTITLQHDEGKSSYSFVTDSKEEIYKEFGYGGTKLVEETDIKSGEDIVLYVIMFNKSNVMSIYDPQEYAQEPKKLKQYDFVYILKCRFLEDDPS